MEAGKLRQSITVSLPVTAQDAYGQPGIAEGPPVLVLTAQAQIMSLAARGAPSLGSGWKQMFSSGAGWTSNVTHAVLLRYPAVTLTAGMVVAYGTRTFLVQAVIDPDERQRELFLMCLEQDK